MESASDCYQTVLDWGMGTDRRNQRDDDVEGVVQGGKVILSAEVEDELDPRCLQPFEYGFAVLDVDGTYHHRMGRIFDDTDRTRPRPMMIRIIHNVGHRLLVDFLLAKVVCWSIVDFENL